MNLDKIPVDRFFIKPFDLWSHQWLLLTAGDFAKTAFNTMTVAWGSFGVMWNKPFALVVVRPTRYTFNFIEQYQSFTLCAFSEKYRQALEFLGSKSGRNGDKITQSGLHLIPSRSVAAPSFEEAELIVECRKIYWDDFDPKHFIDKTIERNYPGHDYHRIFFGEIVSIWGSNKFFC